MWLLGFAQLISVFIQFVDKVDCQDIWIGTERMLLDINFLLLKVGYDINGADFGLKPANKVAVFHAGTNIYRNSL